MISVRSVSKSYGEKPVLDSIDLEIGAGCIFGLLGPNGAGKTTLLNLLSCQIPLTGGEAFIDGLSIIRDAGAIREKIGLVPQEIAMYRKLTVGENLTLMGLLHGMEKGDCREAVKTLLERVRLSASAGLRVEHCSTGMRQALNVAMGLVHDPKVILLDEPTEGLDPAVRRAVWGLLRELAEEGRTLLLTTHIMSEAERYCDEVAFLHAGTVRAVGTPLEVRERFAASSGPAGTSGSSGASEDAFEEVFLELAKDEDGYDRL